MCPTRGTCAVVQLLLGSDRPHCAQPVDRVCTQFVIIVIEVVFYAHLLPRLPNNMRIRVLEEKICMSVIQRH